MQLFTITSNLKSFVVSEKKFLHKIAFIPTMGALHAGHLSLIDIGKKYSNVTVCSIYVNPSQFNNADDLIKYPKSFEKDARLLESVGCNVLFAPKDEEVYPKDLNTQVNLDLMGMDQVMEGQFRPGHFKGMLQVVKRLLDLVNPDYLIMGQKDFQQFTLVKHMILQLDLPVKLIIAPTLRESDGLAMSSRNTRLNAEERVKAAFIYQCLIELKNNINNTTITKLEANAMDSLEKAGLKPEYVEIVDGNTLQRIDDLHKHDYIVVCLAAWCGELRLIDNFILKGTLS